MSRKGNCWDNAVAESFFATLRAELIDNQRYATRDAALRSIGDYIENFYNIEHRHLAIYDLELYLNYQAELARSDGNGFFETTEEFFAHSPTDFSGETLQGHKVAPGTGVMMLANVVFRFTDEKHHHLHWHIEQVHQRGHLASPAFSWKCKRAPVSTKRATRCRVRQHPHQLVQVARRSAQTTAQRAQLLSFKTRPRTVRA